MLLSVAGVTVLAIAAPYIPAAYDKTLPPREAWVRSVSNTCPGPTNVKAQLYISKLHSVNEKVESISIEAYFRLRWSDWRLANMSSSGCAVNRSHGDAGGLWVPDFYFENSLRNSIASKYDGEMVTVDNDGNIFWSTRARLTLDCTMQFWKMPWDEQNCPIKLGLYRSYAASVTIEWDPDGAIVWSPDTKVTHWIIERQKTTSTSTIATYSTGSYSSATATIVLKRNTDSTIIFQITVALFFVFASYTGFFIAPAAAPARVALGFLCFLMVLNNLNALRGKLPDGLSVGDCWLLLFMFYCMLFNFIPLISYAVVNFASTVHGQNNAKRKEAEKKAEDSTRGISVDGVDVVVSPSFGVLEHIEKLRNLDVMCRWMFPVMFVFICLCVLVPIFFAGPLK